jgi:hypothetical protein
MKTRSIVRTYPCRTRSQLAGSPEEVWLSYLHLEVVNNLHTAVHATQSLFLLVGSLEAAKASV